MAGTGELWPAGILVALITRALVEPPAGGGRHVGRQVSTSDVGRAHWPNSHKHRWRQLHARRLVHQMPYVIGGGQPSDRPRLKARDLELASSNSVARCAATESTPSSKADHVICRVTAQYYIVLFRSYYLELASVLAYLSSKLQLTALWISSPLCIATCPVIASEAFFPNRGQRSTRRDNRARCYFFATFTLDCRVDTKARIPRRHVLPSQVSPIPLPHASRD